MQRQNVTLLQAWLPHPYIDYRECGWLCPDLLRFLPFDEFIQWNWMRCLTFGVTKCWEWDAPGEVLFGCLKAAESFESLGEHVRIMVLHDLKNIPKRLRKQAKLIYPVGTSSGSVGATGFFLFYSSSVTLFLNYKIKGNPYEWRTVTLAPTFFPSFFYRCHWTSHNFIYYFLSKVLVMVVSIDHATLYPYHSPALHRHQPDLICIQ